MCKLVYDCTYTGFTSLDKGISKYGGIFNSFEIENGTKYYDKLQPFYNLKS